MNQDIKSILDSVEEYERTCPESVGLDLRLHLSRIILRNLRYRGWSQRDLANETGYQESFISRVLHGNANCTFETVGRLLFALDVRAVLEEKTDALSVIGTESGFDAAPFTVLWEGTDAQETYQAKRFRDTATLRIAAEA